MATVEQMKEIVSAHEDPSNKIMWDHVRQREGILVQQVLVSDEASLKEKGFLKGIQWVLNLNKTLRDEIHREEKKAAGRK